MARKKCKDCLTCFNVAWVENKRYYHCWLCNTWYEGRDDNLQLTEDPFAKINVPVALEEQPIEDTYMRKYGFICDNEHGFELEMSLEEYTSHAHIVGQVDTNPITCPSCGSKNVKRTYTAIPVIFNGDGFTKSVSED